MSGLKSSGMRDPRVDRAGGEVSFFLTSFSVISWVEVLPSTRASRSVTFGDVTERSVTLRNVTGLFLERHLSTRTLTFAFLTAASSSKISRTPAIWSLLRPSAASLRNISGVMPRHSRTCRAGCPWGQERAVVQRTYRAVRKPFRSSNRRRRNSLRQSQCR